MNEERNYSNNRRVAVVTGSSKGIGKAIAMETKKYRQLSVAECARIQTFPDDFQFVGSLEPQYRLVGNVMPPLLERE